MRTSTAVFLMIFLCLASSHDRRSQVREFVSDVRSTVREFVQDNRESWQETRAKRGSATVDTPRMRELKAELREIDSRQEDAKKAMRAIDRSVRSLKDRVTDLRRDSCSKRRSDVYDSSVELLGKQIAELEGEKAQLQNLLESLDNHRVQVQSSLELESVRIERQEIEKLMERSNSPLDRLAGAPIYSSR